MSQRRQTHTQNQLQTQSQGNKTPVAESRRSTHAPIQPPRGYFQEEVLSLPLSGYVHEEDFSQADTVIDDFEDVDEVNPGMNQEVTELAGLDLQRSAAQSGQEAVRLLKNLTKLLVSPKEATSTKRKEIAKILRGLMTHDLYLSPEAVDKVICKVCGTDSAFPVLSKWGMETVRKTRGKFAFFARQYFEGALQVPHLGKLTAPDQVQGIIAMRKQNDGVLGESARETMLKKATVHATRKALNTKANRYLLERTRKITKGFFD